MPHPSEDPSSADEPSEEDPSFADDVSEGHKSPNLSLHAYTYLSEDPSLADLREDPSLVDDPSESYTSPNNYPPIPTDLPSHPYEIPPIPMTHVDRYRILAQVSERLPPQAVLRIMPEALRAIETGEVAFIAEFIRPLLRNVNQNNMHAAIKPIMDVLLDRTESFVRHGEITEVDRLQRLYHRIISALGQVRYRFGTKEERKAANVHAEVARATQHLIDLLSSMPSSSHLERQPQLTEVLMVHLLSRPVFSRELYPVIKAHLQKHDMDLLASQWNRLRTTAGLLKDTEMEREYAARLRSRLERKLEVDTGGLRNVRQPDISLMFGIEHLRAEERKERDDTTLGRLAGRLSAPGSWEVVERISADLGQRIAPENETYRTLAQEAIQAMANAGPNASLNDLYAILSPYLANDAPLIPRRHAWSLLLTRVANDPEVTAEALLGIAGTVPADSATARALTPVMRGLLLRDQAQMAWAVWEELVEKEKGGLESRGTYVDRVALDIASQVCHVLYGLELAVKMVDSWATRPWMPVATGNQLAHSIALDVRNVNVLLRMCRTDQNPSVAFRLWSAAASRWGVGVDHMSLKMLLDVARYAEANEQNPDFLPTFASDLRDGWRVGTSALSSKLLGTPNKDAHELKKSEPFDLAALAEGPTSVLLDPPDFDWNHQFVDRPWEYARRLFLEVTLNNYPHLKEIHSPLTEVDTRLPFFPSPRTPRPGSPFPESFPIRRQLPSLTSRYTSVLPNATSFNSYIALLGYYRLTDEIPVVLAWMKELEVRPRWSTMRMALIFIMESAGPRRWVRGWGSEGQMRMAKDEDIMRRWLEEWLGDGTEMLPDGDERSIVPTSDDVLYWRRMMMEMGKKVTI
ncbi:hypothetical protein IAT38_005185 [Cryptococcus sp. DSM 104549]